MTPVHYSAHLIKIATQKIGIGPGYVVINRMTIHSESTGTIECIGYLLPKHANLAPAFLQTCEALDFVQEFKR